METLCCVDSSFFGVDDETEDTLLKKKPDIKESETMYNLNPPLLYLLIESFEWDEVLSRCSSHPQEIGAWVACKAPNSDIYRWHHLPIHAAVVMKADIRVIKALVDPFPKSIRRKDHLGRLPCHLAIQHDAREEVLDYMINLYPESMSIEDNKGRVPLAWIFDSEEPKLGLRSSIAIYLNIERNKTKDKEQANMKGELEKIRCQYDENLEWIKNERDTDRQSMEESIKELEEESSKDRKRLEKLSLSKDDSFDEFMGSQAKIDELEEKLRLHEKESFESQKKIKELNSIISSRDDTQTCEHIETIVKRETNDGQEKVLFQLQSKTALLQRNQKKNLELVDDLEAARKSIKNLEEQIKCSAQKYQQEIQEMKKSIQSAETIKNVMKERLAKLTNSLVNIEYDAQKKQKLKDLSPYGVIKVEEPRLSTQEIFSPNLSSDNDGPILVKNAGRK